MPEVYPDIPNSIQWLLDFLNLRSIPGESNPKKILFPQTSIRRTPTIPPKDTYNHETGYHGITDHKGYTWNRDVESNEPMFLGKAKFFPRKDDFKDFFLKHGIVNANLIENKDICDKVLFLWNELSMAFARLLTNNKKQQEFGQGAIKSFCNYYLKNYSSKEIRNILLGRIPESNFIPDTIYLSTLQWFNDKELHPFLKQCQCCGKFWIKEKSRKGRERKFCSDECDKGFHKWSRQEQANYTKSKRSQNKKDQQKKDYPEMIKWLMNKEGYTPRDAKKKANQWIFEIEKSFAEYKRTIGKSYGIL